MRAIAACLSLFLVLLLAACATPTPPPTPLPTDTPAPTADLAATSTAIAATVEAQLAEQLTATAEAATSEANAVATAVQATRYVEATATAARAATYAAQTATERARATPTDTPTRTATPRPTNTAGPSPTPRPPNTPTQPPTSLSVVFNDIRYETWGRPVGDPNPCSLFDNSQPVRKFNVNVVLTNHGTTTTGFWYVDAYDSNGSILVTCFYVYGDWRVPPGESREVTWAAFTNVDTYVQKYVVIVLDDQENKIASFVQCFTADGQLSGCE